MTLLLQAQMSTIIRHTYQNSQKLLNWKWYLNV